jgi:predicted MFS family arabinose efflux permease
MSRRELLGSLCGMVFLVNFGRIAFAPLVQPVAAEFGVAAASLGVVTSATWVGSAAPRIPAGYLLTRFSRHGVLVGTGAWLAGAAVFTAFASSILHLAVGAFLLGLASGVYFVAAKPLVSELFPERVGSVLGVVGMTSQVAAVAAPLLLSAILLVGDWRATFFAVAAGAVAVTGWLVWAARRTDMPAAGAEDRSLLVAAREQWPLIVLAVATIGSVGFAWNAVFNLYGDYLTVVKGIEPGTGRTLLSVMFAGGGVAYVFAGRVTDRYRTIPLIVVFGSAFAASVLGLTLAAGLAAVALTSIGIGGLFFAAIVATEEFVLSSLPDRHRASSFAVYSAISILIQALGAGIVGTFVAGGGSYTTAFRALALGIVVVLAAVGGLYATGRLPASALGRPDASSEAAN